MRRILICLLLFLGTAGADELKIVEAGQWNVFLDDKRVQVHLIHRPDSRLVFAFPAENSGVAFWYKGEMRYREGSLKSVPTAYGQSVAAEFEVGRPLTIETVILDSIRTIRDHQHGAATVQEVRRARSSYAGGHRMAAEWGRNSVTLESGQLVVKRSQPSYGPYELRLEGNVSLDEERLRVGAGRLRVRIRCPFPKSKKLTRKELLGPDFMTSSGAREKAALDALEFLTTEEKMMAGSWRFLTYFGRDTLISLSMLEPILSDQALVNGMTSVLTRLSPEGAVAHEEDIGSWAEWRHLQEEPPRFSLEPVYDYKMIDDDLLLPVVLLKLKENGRTQVWDTLLRDSKSDLVRNANYCLGRLSEGRPLLLNPSESVGEWRDSETGLAGGVDPYSVNGALTVAALRALVEIYQALGEDRKAAKAAALVPVHKEIGERFWRTLSVAELKSRLERFTLSLPEDQRPHFESLLDLEELKGGFTLPALSFSADGGPNLVSHTDVAFNLFYDELTRGELDRILDFLEQPFPLGVMTEVGPVCANPALSAEPRHHHELGFGRYHGVVVWSWPSAMLQLGLMRQARLHPETRPRVEPLLQRLEAAETRVGELANSELWGVTLTRDGLKARGYGQGGDQTESNAMQLWSTVYPAVRHVRHRFNGDDMTR